MNSRHARVAKMVLCLCSLALPACRGCMPSTTTSLLLASAGLLVASNSGRRSRSRSRAAAYSSAADNSCGGVPAAVVIYPSEKWVVARNAVIYIYRNRRANLHLMDKGTKKRIETRELIHPNSHLVQMVPVHSLKPNTAYEVRGRRSSKQKNWDTLRSFRTSGSSATPGSAELTKAKVSFSRLKATTQARGKQVRAGSRVATLEMEATNPIPAVVEIQIAFSPPGGKTIRRHLFLPYEPSLIFGAPSRCWSMLPRVPLKGTYKVVVRPWSAEGNLGRFLVRDGRV